MVVKWVDQLTELMVPTLVASSVRKMAGKMVEEMVALLADLMVDQMVALSDGNLAPLMAVMMGDVMDVTEVG